MPPTAADISWDFVASPILPALRWRRWVLLTGTVASGATTGSGVTVTRSSGAPSEKHRPKKDARIMKIFRISKMIFSFLSEGPDIKKWIKTIATKSINQSPINRSINSRSINRSIEQEIRSIKQSIDIKFNQEMESAERIGWKHINVFLEWQTITRLQTYVANEAETEFPA